MEQEDAIDRSDGPLGELLVHAVQRVPRLKRHDVLATGLRQHLPGLGRRAAQVLKVIVSGELQDPDRTGRVEPAPAGHLMDERVFGVMSAEHPFRQVGWIPGVHLVDRHDREQVIHRVAQRDVSADPQARIGRDRQCYRDWEERAVGKPHLGEYAPKICLPHKSINGREPAGRQELQVADDAG
jgi:hypothetical protein